MQALARLVTSGRKTTSCIAQANRTSGCRKSGPNAVEDGLIPAGAEALAADVVFDGLVPL